MIERLKLVDERLKSSLKGLATRGEQIGISRTIEYFLGAMDSIFKSELTNQQYELAEILGKDDKIKEKLREKEKKHHDRSIQRINETLKIFRQERKIIKFEQLKKIDETIKNKESLKMIRDKSIEVLEDAFLEGSEDPNSAKEVIEIFSDVFNIVEEKGGLNGLFDYIEEQIEELKRVRSEEKNRGREKRSPIPWHKVIVVTIIAGFAAGTVIVCFIRSMANEALFFTCVFGTVGFSKPVYDACVWILAHC